MDFFQLKALKITDFSVYRCCVAHSGSLIAPREYHSLSFRLTGDTELSSAGKSFVSKKGDVTYVPKGKTYSHIIHEPSDIILIQFSIDGEPDTDLSVITPVNAAEIEKLFFSLYESWEHNQDADNIECRMYLYKILSRLCAKKELKSFSKNDQILEKSFKYLKDNFTDSNLSIAQLAGISGISEAYFRRLFEKTYTISPVKYLKKLRINYSKRLLETGFYTINEVGVRSGFASASYFSTEFRSETGVTPREYLKRLNKN